MRLFFIIQDIYDYGCKDDNNGKAAGGSQKVPK